LIGEREIINKGGKNRRESIRKEEKEGGN